MAILQIMRYPEPVLRRVADPVRVIDGELIRLAKDMIETMHDAEGVGLAAPQIGKSVRMVVIDFTPGEEGGDRVLINPVVTYRSREKQVSEEGCLSFPGIRTKIKRPLCVTCSAQDLEGNVVEHQGEGLSARAILHEIDHLDGLLFVDKAGPTGKLSIREDLEELEESYRELHQE